MFPAMPDDAKTTSFHSQVEEEHRLRGGDGALRGDGSPEAEGRGGSSTEGVWSAPHWVPRPPRPLA